MTDTSRYQTKRARVHLRKEGTATFRDIDIVDAATFSFQDQTITKQSTNEVIGEVARKTVSVAGTLSIDMGSTEWANFLVATHSRESTQAAVVASTFALPSLKAGQQFKLPSVNITDIAITGLVEGVDFVVYKTSGLVKALVDIVDAISGCSYSAGLAKRGAFTAGGRVNYEAIVDDILNGEVHQFYKWNPDLPQNIALVKPNEFGMYQVTGALLLDQTKPADGEYGQFGVKYEVATA